MSHTVDKTLKDKTRREVSFSDQHKVKSVLPQHFSEDYPKLVSFLENYYEFEDDDQSPSSLIHSLFETRDITAADLSLLSFIEDELLLGEQYFEGFVNKRAAARYSNTFYKSKGTLFSLQQFFRMFFGIAPDIEYPKKYIFNVGQSAIGPESIRYIQDDKLYQNYAINIKADIPLAKWKEAYKLFAHPAGMYLGAEVQAVASGLMNDFDKYAPDALPPRALDPIVLATGNAPVAGVVEITGLIQERYGKPFGVTEELTDDESMYRVRLPFNINAYGEKTIEELDRQYDNLNELYGVSTPTFDEDSDGTDFRAPRMSNIDDTMDEVSMIWHDERLETYPQLDSADWPDPYN